MSSGRTGRLLARFFLETMIKDKEFMNSLKKDNASDQSKAECVA